MTPSLIYRINEVVQMLSVSRGTVYRLVKAGHLKFVKVGLRSSGITAESLEQHLRRIGAT
jgi:excisionase family DNA binding protein